MLDEKNTGKYNAKKPYVIKQHNPYDSYMNTAMH
jgi:hypothetical protein